MEDLLSNLGSGGIWLSWLPNFGDWVSLPPGSVSVSIICAAAGAVILGKFSSDVGGLTLPLNYIGLLIGAIAANWGFAGTHLPLDAELQAPFVFAMTGMSVAGVVMMAILRRL